MCTNFSKLVVLNLDNLDKKITSVSTVSTVLSVGFAITTFILCKHIKRLENDILELKGKELTM